MIGTTYIIYNLYGQSLLRGKIISEEMILELDRFSTGNYLIIFGNNMNQVIKIIKK